MSSTQFAAHSESPLLAVRGATALAYVLGCALAAPVTAQVIFHEDFEGMGFVPIGGWGPQGLISEGWVFDNNSQPLGPQAWFSGCCWGGLISPLSGTGYLAASQDSAAGGAPQYSAWAILPPIPDMQAGDVFSFYTISSDTSSFDNVSLQVRFSPSGGVNTGVGAGDVGDFTEILLNIPTMPNYNSGLADGWTYWEFAIPGPGRIALRQNGSESLYFGIEDITISAPETPTIFPEDFENLGGVCGEGPCALIDDGWIFVDQSSPAHHPAWEPNEPLDPLESHEGFGHMKSVSSAGGGSFLGGVNNWAILPDALKPGDVLSFFVTAGLGDNGVLEVRYSPSGGTNTGSGLTGVGDFTQVLVSLTGIPYGPWQPVTTTVPGEGRVAIRFHVPFIPAFSGSRVVAIDSMAVNETIPGPPLPQPGETVVWTAAMSPITIDFNTSIPPSATLIIDPGVVIHIETGKAITYAGEVYAEGTAADPIIINGWAPFFDAFLAAPTGHAEFMHVTMMDGRFEPTFATDCMVIDSVLDARRITGCTFAGSGASTVDGNMSITDSSFTGGSINLLRGYLHIDNIDMDGGVISLTREDAGQIVYLNNISIANTTNSAAFLLGGWSYFLGDNNTLTNNLYPIELRGGLAPGSTVPRTGNLNNFAVLANNDGPTGHDRLPPLPVPYLLPNLYVAGAGLEVLPGAEFVGLPGSNLWEQFGMMRLLGTPDDPILFRGQSSGPGAWHGIQWSLSDGKAEYCIVRDSQFGMLADESILRIDNCTFENNAHGSRTTSFGISYVRKSQFLDNVIGVSATPNGSFNLLGQTNRNALVGNGQGAIEEDPGDSPDARHNWWGHPSGPTTPDNPGGQGDIAGANVISVPFATAPPDFSDTPPVVRVQEISRVVETGSPLILHWDASDDHPSGGIVSQRVRFTETGAEGSAIVLLDNLPATQRSALITVPASPFFGSAHFIVEAIDNAGQIGNDVRRASIVDPVPGEFELPAQLVGPFVTGEEVDWDPGLGNTYAILLDHMNELISLGAGVLPFQAPYISTDTARLAAISINGNRLLSDYFTIRPPAFIDDAPPSVTLLSPSGGALAGGSNVNVSWTASDDEAVRAFDLQGSYDGERTWHFIRRDLPGDSTSFAWQLPPTDQPVSDVRLRIVVYDLRFQSTSDTVNLSITAGMGGDPADLNNDGGVNAADLALLLGAWGPCTPCPADLNDDGSVNAADLALLLGAWG